MGKFDLALSCGAYHRRSRTTTHRELFLVLAKVAHGNASLDHSLNIQVDVNLIDLAIPTPYTCSFSIVIDQECGTDTVVWSPTATVNGILHSLTAPSTQLFTPGTDFVALTFENLIVTSLVPGEIFAIKLFNGADGEYGPPLLCRSKRVGFRFQEMRSLIFRARRLLLPCPRCPRPLLYPCLRAARAGPQANQQRPYVSHAITY